MSNTVVSTSQPSAAFSQLPTAQCFSSNGAPYIKTALENQGINLENGNPTSFANTDPVVVLVSVTITPA